jgi:hypothetical protein
LRHRQFAVIAVTTCAIPMGRDCPLTARDQYRTNLVPGRQSGLRDVVALSFRC